MRNRPKTFMVLAAIALLGALATGERAQSQDAEPAAGQEAFLAHKCNLCHAVPAAEIEAKTRSEKMKGSDLGGPVEMPVADLLAFLRKESEVDGAEHKKEYKGTAEELQAIVDWLAGLDPPAEVASDG